MEENRVFLNIYLNNGPKDIDVLFMEGTLDVIPQT